MKQKCEKIKLLIVIARIFTFLLVPKYTMLNVIIYPIILGIVNHMVKLSF